MSKFHINKNGVPSVCKATKGNCPLGGNDSHFESKEEAQEYADRVNESEHGLLPEVENRGFGPRITVNEMVKSVSDEIDSKGSVAINADLDQGVIMRVYIDKVPSDLKYEMKGDNIIISKK